MSDDTSHAKPCLRRLTPLLYAGFVFDAQENALASCTFIDDEVHYHGTADITITTTLPSGEEFNTSTTAVGEILCTYIFKASTDPEVAGMFNGLNSFFHQAIWLPLGSFFIAVVVVCYCFPKCDSGGEGGGAGGGGCGGGGGGCGGGGGGCGGA